MKLLDTRYQILDSREGLTLIELLLFSAIFSAVMIAFSSILVTVTNIQSKQASISEVTGQSSFVLQQIENYVERSSLIDLPQDAATTTFRIQDAGSLLPLD